MKRRIIIGLFVLLILSTAIFLLYRSGFREGQVVLKIEAPEEIVSGEEIEYKLIVENKNNFDLDDVKLSFSYPEDAIGLNDDGQPISSSINKFDLTVLDSREKKEFVLKAILTGEKWEIKKAKANLTYSPSNLRSVFQKNAEVSTTISEVSISLVLSAPPSVLSGQRVQVSLDFRNETDDDFNDLQVLFTYPDGFSFKKATPSSDEGSNIFNLDSLKAGEGERITVEGDISGFEKEEKEFTATLKKKIGDKYFDFQKARITFSISTPLLTTEVSINDQGDFIAEIGDKLEYKIKFFNNSDSSFSALELTAKLEGQMFDFSTLKTDGFYNQNSRTILWNAASRPIFSDLAPGQSGEVSFEIDLKDDFPQTFGAKNYSLKVSVALETQSVPPDFDLDKISATSELITKVSSKTSFTSQAFYSDSVFSNSGPTPPRVGQKTTYTIHWKIVNEGSDLINVEVFSSLPSGISWENKYKLTPSSSEIRYDPSLGRVTWLISTVPAGSGTTTTAFEAVFQVGITPTLNQIGQAAEIIKEINLKAVDNFTKENVSLTQSGITTSTISDVPGTVQP